MGHMAGREPYERLRRRLDMHPIGAPPGGPILEILRTIFPGELAEFAARLPLGFFTVRTAARRSGRTAAEAEGLLDRLADRGVVIDFEQGGTRRYVMAPTYSGFFEFMFMRTRTDVDQKELARLLHEYEDGFVDAWSTIFAGPTQFGRMLVNEDRIPERTWSEVFDYERASALIRDAKAVSVGMCYCRHVAGHVGKACRQDVHVCMSLGAAAAALARRGLARSAGKSEALEILARCREAGLAQIVDNVRNRPTFMCHCCGCCCGQLRAVKKVGHLHPVHSSNFIASIDQAACNGCAACAKRCPVDAVAAEDMPPVGGKRPKRVGVLDDVCLGCGVCAAACKPGALRMAPRPVRVLMPDSTLDRLVLQAVERGKLQNFLFDDPERLDHRLLGAALGSLLRLPSARRALAAKQVRSRFVDIFLRGAVPSGLRSLFGRG